MYFYGTFQVKCAESLFCHLHMPFYQDSLSGCKKSRRLSMERQYIMVFLELLPLTRICSINQLKQVSYSVLFFFTISRNMLGLSGDLNITSVLSSINCKCSIISPFTFFVDVAVQVFCEVCKTSVSYCAQFKKLYLFVHHVISDNYFHIQMYMY